MHSGKVRGLESGQLSLSPQSLHHLPSAFPEPHFLFLNPPRDSFPRSSQEPLLSHGEVPLSNSGIHWCWDPSRTARERPRADLPALVSQRQASTAKQTSCQEEGAAFLQHAPPTPAVARGRHQEMVPSNHSGIEAT